MIGPELPRYAQVFMLDVPAEVDRPFHYSIPPNLRADVRVGNFVVVPFGRSNKRRFALVTGVSYEVPDYIQNITKPVLSSLYRDVVLDEEMLRLCNFLRDYTLCTMGDAVRAVVPTAAFGRLNEYYYVLREPPITRRYNERDFLLVQFVKLHDRVSFSRIRSEFGGAVVDDIAKLVKDNILGCDTVHADPTDLKTEVYALTDTARAFQLSDQKKFGSRQLAILNALIGRETMTGDELKEAVGPCRPQLKALLDKGILTCKTVEKYRDPYAQEVPTAPPDDNILSQAQKEALAQILALYQTGQPKAALLHGITGSGKTRVIKAAMDHVLSSGRQIILLIPEISLTPQTVGYFRACYGERVAVIHSSLSNGERYDMWKRIRRGEVDICIGTRSAIFAPFSNIGMIVIDEEQEHTYKSDMSPRYHARDVARFRCARHNALMLLASATPSIESYYKAKNGKYTLISLKERYGGATLPEVLIADQRKDARDGNTTSLGSILRQELQLNLTSQEQSVLFLNRRGFHNYLSCPLCGNVVMCPHCSVSLTYHTRRSIHGGSTSYLACHWCGHLEAVPEVCPSCQNPHLRYMGYGTQKAEEELHDCFPEARVIRMDADTTSSKAAYHNILETFRAGEADILLGTQMVTKGHDFPNVTLSGVLAADSMLYLDDYRANERTFSMITQVIGRAGRADKHGRAIIQTYNPDHPTIRMAAAQDYVSFYENEIAMRRALLFPPFCDIVLVTLMADNEPDLDSGCEKLDEFMRERLHEDFRDLCLQCFGPFEATVYKFNEKYRKRLVIKCRLNSRTRHFFRIMYDTFSEGINNHLTMSIDLNPNNL